jgi:lipid A 3-O-deacylase
MKYLLLFFLLLSVKPTGLQSSEILPPHLVLAGGYSDGRRYSGGLLQIEYLFANYYLTLLRPEVMLLSPNLKSAFFGVGIRAEIRVGRHFLLMPSFIPGLYTKGEGKDLGFPLEFRSCMEIAYEFTCKFRLGVQVYHISNASLSTKNPGLNSFAATLAIPLSRPCYSKSTKCVR